MKDNKNSNGAPVKSATAPTPAPAKVEAKPTPKPETKPDPVQERINKISGLQKRTEALDTYRTTQKNLNAFSLGSERRNDLLVLADGNGHKFETTNTDAIRKVMDTLKAEVGAKILSTETEILEAQF